MAEDLLQFKHARKDASHAVAPVLHDKMIRLPTTIVNPCRLLMFCSHEAIDLNRVFTHRE